MFAVDDDRKCRQALRGPQGRDIHKCFILTPSFHYINPLFSPVSSRKTRSPEFPLSPERTNTHLVTPPSSKAAAASAGSSPPRASSSLSFLNRVKAANSTRPELKNEAAVKCESLFRSPRRPNRRSPEQKSNIAATTMKPRMDASIIPLTKRFNRLLNESPNQSLNLKQVAKYLGVQRRRIYDITSVLEGVGIIEKHAQNVVRCVPGGALGGVPASFRSRKRKNSDNNSSCSDSDGIGGPPKLLKTLSASSSPYYATLCQEIGDLKDEERELDRFIHYLKSRTSAAVQSSSDRCSQNLITSVVVNQPESNTATAGSATPQALVPSSANPSKHHLLYLSYDDIASVAADCTNNTILGIRTPPGTFLEVPDPDRGEKPGVRRFEVCLSSRPSFVSKYEQPQRSDKINVHLIRPAAGRGQKKNN